MSRFDKRLFDSMAIKKAWRKIKGLLIIFVNNWNKHINKGMHTVYIVYKNYA